MFALSVSLTLLGSGIVLIGRVTPNVKTTFKPDVAAPVIAQTARIHPLAAVDGSVITMAASCMDSKRSRGL